MDASYELMVAAIGRLRTFPAITSEVTWMGDRPPQKPAPVSPYISFGPSSSVPDDFDCQDGEEITIQLDVWSWGPGDAKDTKQVRRIASNVKRALHGAELSLPTNVLVTLQHQLTRVMTDPDGITSHAAIQFTAVVETPDL